MITKRDLEVAIGRLKTYPVGYGWNWGCDEDRYTDKFILGADKKLTGVSKEKMKEFG